MKRVLLVVCIVVAGTVVERAPSAEEYEGVLGLRDRLCALEAGDPRAYFELGEEVAYEMPGAEGRALAERLFVLALERDMRDGGRDGLAASACIALADLTPRESERAWLLALAETFDQGEGGWVADPGGTPGVGEERVAEAIGLFRGEAFRGARERLRREDGAKVFASLEEDLGELGMSMEAMESRASCPECRNRRVVRPGSGHLGGREWVSCGRCGGNPGARLGEEAFVGLLVIEAELLGVEADTWSAQYVADGGEPIRDVDPSELALWYGVDPEASMYRCPESDDWRDGQWVREEP